MDSLEQAIDQLTQKKQALEKKSMEEAEKEGEGQGVKKEGEAQGAKKEGEGQMAKKGKWEIDQRKGMQCQ